MRVLFDFRFIVCLCAKLVGWLVEPSFGMRLSDSDFMTVLFKWIFAYGIANSIKYKLSISAMIMVAVAIVCGRVW